MQIAFLYYGAKRIRFAQTNHKVIEAAPGGFIIDGTQERRENKGVIVVDGQVTGVTV